MPTRSRFILTMLALGALACGVVAAWWWFDADRQAFYTDDSAIRTSVVDAPVRDILWRPPEPLRSVAGDPIVGRDPVISADGDTLLLTRISDTGDADLFIAGRVGNAWTEPRSLAQLNTIDNELSPSLSADGQRLYFASDRPGGAGGLDIWISLREGDLWLAPSPLGFNTRDDETDPHPFIRSSGAEAVLFSSDRPRDGEVGEPPLTDFDLYLADIDSTSPRHLHEFSSPARDAGPAITTAGDFVYFTSDRETGTGGYDLYRARIRTDSTSEVIFDTARSLGTSINTTSDELDPSLSLEGFAIQFATMVDDQPRLMRAVSKEVYLARSTTRGSLLGLIPWILLALAIVLLLALLRRTVRDAQWQARIATLGLMAKYALVSLVIHAGIMALLAALQVPPTAGQPNGKPEGLQVALSSSALRSSVSDQMRGSSAPAALAQASTPAPVAPAVSTATSSSSITFQPQSTPAPTGSPLQPSTTVRESSVATPAIQIADAGTPDLPAIQAQTPALGMPEAPAAEPLAQAETGIDAPALASSSRTSQATDIEIASGSTPNTVTLDAAEASITDGSLFSPSATVGEASPSGTEPTQLDALTGESIELPELDALGPTLAMPSTGEAEAAPAEQGSRTLELAEADTRAVPAPVAGDVAVPLTDFDATSTTLDIPEASLAVDAEDFTPASSPPEPTLALDLAPPTLAAPQLNLPETIAHRFELLGIVIDEETEQPLANAQVRLDLEGTADLTETTNDDGTFALGFDEIPDNAALTAVHEGYTPGAVNIAQRDLRAGRRVVVRLRKIDPFVIVMEAEPEVHHLGNDEFSGSINSQFQRRSEGLVLKLPFEMTRDHAQLRLRGAELRVLVKGTQAPNPVRINGRQIATLAQSPRDGSFREQVLTIPSGLLRLGRNVLEFESVARPGSDKDDYEFVNPRVVLLVDEEAEADPI
ncbi:MAG: hypothetical protein NCW75_14665 [Phycisphaera sp.]|nr:MAG: hypothetical protein NCW75_14665 [Phycisphaera sp.]